MRVTKWFLIKLGHLIINKKITQQYIYTNIQFYLVLHTKQNHTALRLGRRDIVLQILWNHNKHELQRIKFENRIIGK